MIGGSDIVLEGPAAKRDGSTIVATFRRVWPGLVVQEASAAGLSDDTVVDAVPVEFFAYRDLDAFRSWSEHGATEQNIDALIHVIIDSDCITFVVADSRSQTRMLALMATSELTDARESKDATVITSPEPVRASEEADDRGGRWGGPWETVSGSFHA